MEDVVHFALSIRHPVDIFHYGDLEDFLAAVCYDREYEIMIKVETLLIKR